MDIQDNNNNMTLNTIKTPEAESETPTRIQSSNPKPLPFSNGLLKRHPLTQTPPPVQPSVFVYRECLKNHAANLGGHALDGCGEFMSSPSSTPTDPTSLKCAACGCHRNFHRRSTDQYHSPNSRALIEYQPHHRHHPPPPDGAESPNSPSPPPISSAYYPASAPHMLLALSAGLSGQQPENSPAIGHVTAPNGRKRFRTKFTQNQKERMLEFAEKIGWKFQKRDEDVIAEFCNEIGVERGVLKVWMHNNKSTRGHRSELNNSNNGGGGVGDGGGNHENNGNEMNKRMRENNSSSESRENHHNGVGGGPVNGGNASSSSS